MVWGNLSLQFSFDSVEQTFSVVTAAFTEKVFLTMKQKKTGWIWRDRQQVGNQTWKFLDTDGAQVSATFSSFISCHSLCITLGFQSDVVHRLENYPKNSPYSRGVVVYLRVSRAKAWQEMWNQRSRRKKNSKVAGLQTNRGSDSGLSGEEESC